MQSIRDINCENLNCAKPKSSCCDSLINIISVICMYIENNKSENMLIIGQFVKMMSRSSIYF